jgi:hypothetical protein
MKHRLVFARVTVGHHRSVNPEFMKIIERSRRSLRKRGGLSIEQVRRRLGHGRWHP